MPRELGMRRVHVVGTSGSGKSTVARSLAQALQLPHVELDALYWLPGWRQRDHESFRALVQEHVAGDAWIVDGNFGTVRDLVWARADTIVWLDLPRPTVMRQVIVRTFRRWWRQELLWAGNLESLRKSLSRDSIVWWAWSTHARRRAEYAELLQGARQKVVHLTSRRAVDEWLAGFSR